MQVSRRAMLGLTTTGLTGVAFSPSAWTSLIDLRPSDGPFRHRMIMAPTEHRGLHLALGDHRYVRRILIGGLPDGLTHELFRVEQVHLSGNHIVADPLAPIEPSDALTPHDANLFLRLHVEGEAVPGDHQVPVTIEDDRGHEIRLVIDLRVVALDLPDLDALTIQGTLWRPGVPELRQNFDPIGIMHAMRAADINAVALGRGFGNLTELVHTALEKIGFKSVRLPAHRMFNRHDHLTTEQMAANLTATSAHLATFDRLFNRSEWRHRLTYKLWDEPKPGNYDDVIKAYQHVRADRPWLTLELTEEPSDALGDIADIWTVNANRLEVAPIEQRRAIGNEVWFYANQLHSLGRSHTSMRMIGWLMWRYHLEGYHFWSVNWWGEDPWAKTAVAPNAKHKRGTLLFPPKGGRGEVLTTLRLQAFRDGLQDWRWLQWLDQRAARRGDRSAEARFAQALRGKISWIAALKQRIDLDALQQELQAFVLEGGTGRR